MLLLLMVYPFGVVTLTHLFWIFILVIMYPFEVGIAILPLLVYCTFTIICIIINIYICFCTSNALSGKIQSYIVLLTTFLVLTTAFTFFFYYSFVRHELQKDTQNSLLTLLTAIFPSVLLAVSGWLVKKMDKKEQKEKGEPHAKHSTDDPPNLELEEDETRAVSSVQ